MGHEQKNTLNSLITQKNLVLWSGAIFALVLVAVDPHEGATSGAGLNGSTQAQAPTGTLPAPSASREAQPSPSLYAGESHTQTVTRSAALPVAWYQNRTLEISVVHRWLADYRTGLSPSKKQQLAEALYHESLSHSFQPSLVVALIATESSVFNWSRSKQGAVGLMQLLPMTAEAMVQHTAGQSLSGTLKWRGEEMLFDPLINIKLGLQYLAYLHRQFGDLRIALTAYNYGPTRVAEWLDACEPLPLSYANRVLSLADELERQARTETTFS